LREYETVVVLDASLDDAHIDREIETVSNVITEGGGEVLDVQRWGRRRLSYEIQKKREGIYSLIRYKSEVGVLEELERRFQLNDSLLRHLTVLSRGPASIPGQDERDDEHEGRHGRGDRHGRRDRFRDDDRDDDRDRGRDRHRESRGRSRESQADKPSAKETSPAAADTESKA
jgi:small subunit ribosomal protein S6